MDDVKGEKLEKFEDGALEEDEAGDDPNEYLDVNPTTVESSVWLIKVSDCPQSRRSDHCSKLFASAQVPRGLMDKWNAVKTDGVPLATLRIYKGFDYWYCSSASYCDSYYGLSQCYRGRPTITNHNITA